MLWVTHPREVFCDVVVSILFKGVGIVCANMLQQGHSKLNNKPHAIFYFDILETFNVPFST